MDFHHKHRWIFSPVNEAGVPLAVDYAVQIEAPYIHDGHALCYCAMNAHQLLAARADSRLIVLPSVHHRHKLHPRVAEHHAVHGLHPDMMLHEALEQLAKLHPAFEPGE